MQGIQKAFVTFKSIDADPFSHKRTSYKTPAIEQLFAGFEVEREPFVSKQVLGVGQVDTQRNCSCLR